MDNTPVPPAGRSSQQSGAATEGQRFELPVLSEREMSERRELDGERHTAEMAPDTPLLVLRNDAALLSEAGGPPGARPGQALGGAWLGLKGPPSVRRARAALDRDGPIIG